jgi:hypothetical protein
MDIMYISMARGFVYVAVVLDWASRRVLSWSVSTPGRRDTAQFIDRVGIYARAMKMMYARVRAGLELRGYRVATSTTQPVGALVASTKGRRTGDQDRHSRYSGSHTEL